MTKVATAPIEGEVMTDAAAGENETGRALAAPRQRSRAVAAGGTGGPPDPMELYKIALQKGASVEVMNQLLQLQERVEANTARKAYNAAISAARAEMPVIVKNARVAYDATRSAGKVDYAHETLAQIAEQIDPILARHGLSYRFRPNQPAPGQLTVTCIISHELGHSEENSMTAGIDVGAGKNHLQAIGSATTYLSRYTLKAGLGLSAAEVDDDGKSSPSPRPSVPRASASGGGAGTTTQQQTASDEKPKPHAISTANMKFTQWAGRYVELAKTANTVAELQEWDRLNDTTLTELYNKAREVYDELNAAYQKHLHTLKAKEAAPRRDDPISSGRPPADGNTSKDGDTIATASKWTFPNPTKDYEGFLAWAMDKLQTWTAEAGDIEEFWNDVIEPAMQGAFPTDKDDLMSEYRRAEHRLGG